MFRSFNHSMFVERHGNSFIGDTSLQKYELVCKSSAHKFGTIPDIVACKSNSMKQDIEAHKRCAILYKSVCPLQYSRSRHQHKIDLCTP